MQDPRNVQGSNAETAEAGLNPEAEYAELDEATARRLAMEARAHQEANAAKHAPGAGVGGTGGADIGAGMPPGMAAQLPDDARGAGQWGAPD